MGFEAAPPGDMQQHPLLVSALLEHAAIEHGQREIVSYLADGTVYRYTYADARRGAAAVAKTLQDYGIVPGDRVATLAWNSYRHFEIYYGASGIGAICHTVNPRLFPEQIAGIIQDAQDRILFIEEDLLGLLDEVKHGLSSVEQIVVLGATGPVEAQVLARPCLTFEDFKQPAPESFLWPVFDEATACSLCYTSGTTGRAKGVLYSHRSTVLHAMTMLAKDVFALGAADSVLAAVPMFHVNAWGLPYACPAAGSKLVLPGSHLQGAQLCRIMQQEGVTVAAGVPTLWMGLARHLDEAGTRLSGIERLISGGAPIPESLVRKFAEDFGIPIVHAWGMTELSPVAGVNTPLADDPDWRDPEYWRLQKRQGRAPFGIEIAIMDDERNILPRGDRHVGTINLRGHWVIDHYYQQPQTRILDDAGWFSTGDIGSIDEAGRLFISDREKDLVKSGGEWISSIELENIANGHPLVEEAAVIAAHHEKWGERPLLICRTVPNATLDATDILDFFKGKVASWMIPDAVIFVEKLPHTATGKLSKKTLRELYASYLTERT